MIEIKRKQKQAEGQPAAQKPAERAQKAAGGLEAQAGGIHAPGAEPALKREIKPFTGIDAARDYRAMYRAAFEYHERHNPPQLDLAYWDAAAQDICEVSNRFDNDPFIMDLLTGIYSELEREYKAMQQAAAGSE